MYLARHGAQMQASCVQAAAAFTHAVSSAQMTQDVICADETACVNAAAACTHDACICAPCLAKYIETEMNAKMFSPEIKCPAPNCTQTLKFEEVQRGSEAKVWERYERLLLMKTLEELPEFRNCTNSECGSGQLHNGGDAAPIMRCHACKTATCFSCQIPWHAGETCEEYQIRVQQTQDAASLAEIEVSTKPCPKCSARITKDGGCDHMKCQLTNCKYEFCWLCLADYAAIRKDGNHRHRPTCRYYAEHTPSWRWWWAS
eukprot:TRINITY_DN17728_c0_g1_i1.p2 TRINITY_DN17728_c0_g1~~TRINITY_DN17728_c0_g1_i1.p2  ORF type:complete len:259 (-),score=43.42 TRINITY_DN17728_c0_g1_i1:72-848(-)